MCRFTYPYLELVGDQSARFVALRVDDLQSVLLAAALVRHLVHEAEAALRDLAVDAERVEAAHLDHSVQLNVHLKIKI